MKDVDAKKAHVDRDGSGGGPQLGWLQRPEPAPGEGGTGPTRVCHGYHRHHTGVGSGRNVGNIGNIGNGRA